MGRMCGETTKENKTKRNIARRTEKTETPTDSLSSRTGIMERSAKKQWTAASTVETVYCLLRSGGSSDRPLHWRYYWTSLYRYREHGGFRTRVGHEVSRRFWVASCGRRSGCSHGARVRKRRGTGRVGLCQGGTGRSRRCG